MKTVQDYNETQLRSPVRPHQRPIDGFHTPAQKRGIPPPQTRVSPISVKTVQIIGDKLQLLRSVI